MVTPPILDNKHTTSPSVFAPAALLGERIASSPRPCHQHHGGDADFEKGQAHGSHDVLEILGTIIRTV